MQKIQKTIQVAATVSLFATLANGDAVYENDFSTRTSAGAVPTAEWREVMYETGLLANPGTYSGETWVYDAFGGSDLQDNWIKGSNECKADAYVVDDGGNEEVVVCNGSGRAHGIFRQRLGNVFTNGVVTAQCDFMTPTDWVGYDPLAVRFILGDETFFSLDTSSADYTKYIACGAGVNMVEGAYRFVNYNADNGTTANRGVWYRVVVAANIDAKTCRVSFYDLGSTHPTLETRTPSTPFLEMVDNATKTSKDIKFRSVTQGVELSGISSIGFGAWGVSGNAGDSSRATMAQFDNIRVSHDGVECYVNDFSSRRSRCLAVGTMSAAYAATGSASNLVTYATGTQLVANRVADTEDPQPIGVDGWRRLNKDSYYSLTVALESSNRSGQMSPENSSFSIAAQPIGRTFTSGKVRISADSYVESMADAQNNRFLVALGSDALYNGSNSTFNNGRFAEAGVYGKESGSYRQVRFYANTSVTQPDDRVDTKQWLRYVIEADLDAGTYDFAIYRQTSYDTHPSLNDPDGTLLYSTNGIARIYATVDSISCFMLKSYYAKSWVDNIKVWHTPSGSSERKLVYSNSFTNRYVYMDESDLVGTMRQTPVGIDAWTRLGRSEGEIRLVGGDNPAIGFGTVGEGEDVWAAQDLGAAFGTGKAVMHFDVRVPSGNGCAYVWLGGDQLHEGSLSGGDYGFEKWSVAGAGISNGVFAAWSGNGTGGGAWTTSGAAAPGHWYRFVQKSDLSARSSSVEVYDMGTSHPAASAATPKAGAVATFADVPFRRNVGGGARISCVAVEADGVSEVNLIAGSRLLIDNIGIDYAKPGFVLVVR